MPLAEFQQAILQECMQQQGCPLCRAVWKIDGTRFSIENGTWRWSKAVVSSVRNTTKVEVRREVWQTEKR